MDVQRFLYLIAYDVGQPARLRRVQQIRLSLDPAFCLSCARLLIQHKLGSQIDWLAQLQIEAHPSARHSLGHTLAQLRALHARVPHAHSLASLRGLEGAAAASYFEGLKAVVPASLGFSSRNRRPPKDPFNALLSLTYTLVQAETAIALWGAGLDPYVGYYHALDFGRESLACDLLEPVRVHADRFCLELVRQQTLSLDHFSLGPTGCLLGKAGRARYYDAYEQSSPAWRSAIAAQVSALLERIGCAGDSHALPSPDHDFEHDHDPDPDF